jgi:hypothetical protein
MRSPKRKGHDSVENRGPTKETAANLIREKSNSKPKSYGDDQLIDRFGRKRTAAGVAHWSEAMRAAMGIRPATERGRP